MEYSDLNELQYKAATFNGRHCLVLAGAGTGKTRTLIARARFLIDCGVSPERIVILSYTQKSATGIVDRICSQLDPEKTAGLKGLTFHSWCLDMMTCFDKEFGMQDYTLLNEADRVNCIRMLEQISNRLYEGRKILDRYSYARNSLAYKEFPIEDSGFVKQYNAYKKERKYLDYDDILAITANALKDDADLREKITSRYEHILIDDMQDTNPLQYSLLESFAPGCNLFCVGDDAQSIYGFRGADYKSIHRFKDRFPDSEVIRLTLNYRSTQEILDLSKWLLQQSPLNYDNPLVSARGLGRTPALIEGYGTGYANAHILEDIRTNVGRYGYRYGDHMILARATYKLHSIKGALVKAGIPCTLSGGLSVHKPRHIRLLLSPLRIIANWRDELSWIDYLETAQLEVHPGYTSTGYLPHWSSSIAVKMSAEPSLEDALSAFSSEDIPERCIGPLLKISHLQDSPRDSLKIVRDALEPVIKAMCLGHSYDICSDFDMLEDRAGGYDSVKDFISDCSLDPGSKDRTRVDAEDCVLLSTIHSAHGLEASNCYILDVNPAEWPSRDAEDVEGERRLLYVAMTRAKDKLTLFRVKHDKKQALARYGKYFLSRLPDDLAWIQNHAIETDL